MKAPIRILHLEDNLRDAELIRNRLEAVRLACDIVHISSREQYEAALAEDSFELVLCDYNLPDYDGLSALKLAREKRPLTPVIMISGSVGEEEAVKSLHLGATDYLLKHQLERLPSSVERAMKEAEEHRKRRQAEAKLRENEEMLRDLFENAHDLIQSVRLDGSFLFVNRAWRQTLGYSEAEISGLALKDIVHPSSLAHCQEQFQRVLAGAVLNRVEAVFLTKDRREIVVEGNSSCRFMDGQPVATRSIFRDITERKNTERQMLRAQRLESIGTLASGVAHDLNNALAPILMSTQLLRMEYSDAAKTIDIVESSAKRGADMVRQLLTFAKGVEGARLLVQPRHLFKEMERIIKATFPKNIQLRIQFPRELRTILGDATQLHQVLLNLCVNARDAMPHGGTLTLEAENAEIDATYASAVPEAKPGSYVAWRVKDTGTGIPPEILDRIFDPFFTTKGPDKGTGLGLSTVTGIVRSHGGFLRVYSTPGQGTTFAVYLPVSEAGAAPEVTLKPECGFRGNGETVLVVDDDESVRQITRVVLTALNLQVLTAEDGTEALVKVSEHRADIRLVITDLHMPHLDGLNFVRVLRRMLPQVRVIVASGRMEEREEKEFGTLGVSALLAKPFTQEKLVLQQA